MNTTHRPTTLLSPDGTGIRTTHGCTCGWEPTKGCTSRGSGLAYKAHCRKVGVTPVHASEAITAYGHGYVSEGLTWAQWYAEHKSDDADPFEVRLDAVNRSA